MGIVVKEQRNQLKKSFHFPNVSNEKRNNYNQLKNKSKLYKASIIHKRKWYYM